MERWYLDKGYVNPMIFRLVRAGNPEPRSGAPSLTAPDLCTVFARYIEHHAVLHPTSVLVAADGAERQLYVRPIDLARAARSLSAQLAHGLPHARAWVGGYTDVVLEGTSVGGNSECRMLDKDGVIAAAPGDALPRAIADAWGPYSIEIAALLGSAHPRLEEAWRAIIEGLERPASPANQAAPHTRHVESALDRLAFLAPDVAARARPLIHGAATKTLWRGPQPDESLPSGAMIAAWFHALSQRSSEVLSPRSSPRSSQLPSQSSETDSDADSDDAFFFLIETRRVLFVSQRQGRGATLHETFDLADPIGLAARLAFIWSHRASFRDGIAMNDASIAPLAPLPIRGDRAILLVRSDGEADIRVEPAPEILIGRSQSSDVPIPHVLVSRRQTFLHARPDGWYAADAESVSGTFLNADAIRQPTLLHQGAALRLGGLTVEVFEAT